MNPTKIIDKYLPGLLLTAISASAIWGDIENHVVKAWSADWQGEVASIAFALSVGTIAGMWLVRRFEIPTLLSTKSDAADALQSKCDSYEARIMTLERESQLKDDDIALRESQIKSLKTKIKAQEDEEQEKAKRARECALLLDVQDKLLLISLGYHAFMDIEMDWSELSEQLQLLDDCVEYTEIGLDVHRVWISDYGRRVLEAADDVFSVVMDCAYPVDEPWWVAGEFVEYAE